MARLREAVAKSNEAIEQLVASGMLKNSDGLLIEDDEDDEVDEPDYSHDENDDDDAPDYLREIRAISRGTRP